MQQNNRAFGIHDDIHHHRRSEQTGEHTLRADAFTNEQTRALSARVVAQTTVIEFLLGLVLVDKSSAAAAVFTAHLKELSHNLPDLSVRSDLSPEFLTEVSGELNTAIADLMKRSEIISTMR